VYAFSVCLVASSKPAFMASWLRTVIFSSCEGLQLIQPCPKYLAVVSFIDKKLSYCAMLTINAVSVFNAGAQYHALS